MKKVLKAILSAAVSAVLALGAAMPTAAKNAADMTPQEIAEDMKVGWVLGNSLDSKGQTYVSPAQAEVQWGNPVTTKAMIDMVKAEGFNTVRVPVTWYDKCDSSGNIDSAWLARVKEVVDYGIDNGMYVILNLHHENGGGSETGWLIPDSAHQSGCESKIDSLWTQIANYFKDYDRHLVFETLNEPRMIGSDEEWTGGTAETRSVINALNAKAVSTIRATGGNNATRLIMCPTCAASVAGLDGFVMPSDSNVALSIHNYSPYNYAMNNDSNIAWDKEISTLNSQLASLYNSYVSKGIPVIIGEMGATYKSAYKNGTQADDRVQWANYYTKLARKYGMTCVVWDNNEANGGAENFGVLNRDNMSWYFEDLAKAYVDGANGKGSADIGGTSSISSRIVENEAYTKTAFQGSLSGTDYEPVYKAAVSDFPALSEGCVVVVYYTGVNTPFFGMQNYTNSDWNQVMPASVADGKAYYNYADIVDACEGAFSIQQEVFVQCNNCATNVTKVAVVYPVKKGDADYDAVISRVDGAIVLRSLEDIAALTASQLDIYDYNGDGDVDLRDVVGIVKAAG